MTDQNKLNQSAQQARQYSRELQLKGVPPQLAGEAAVIKVTGVESEQDRQILEQVDQFLQQK
jgi:hypothetical protein